MIRCCKREPRVKVAKSDERWIEPEGFSCLPLISASVRPGTSGYISNFITLCASWRFLKQWYVYVLLDDWTIIIGEK